MNIADLKGLTPLHYLCCLNPENVKNNFSSNDWENLNQKSKLLEIENQEKLMVFNGKI